MTDEEINKAVERAMTMIPHPHPMGGHPENCERCFAQGKLIELVSSLVRTARREAVEECAKTAEQWGAEDDEPTDPDVAFPCLAAAIRALRPPSE